MPLFPLELPADPEGKRDISVNLGQLVGPMFGVISDRSPHGMTWICDFDTVTLKELGRGAPIPTPSDLEDPDSRAIYSPAKSMLKGEIAAATLNRYGPDTKSAVVLTAANVLYQNLVADIEAALQILQQSNPQAAPVMHLAAWATATLLGFRAAPLLCASALRARTYQRAAFTQWHVERPGNRANPARCELGHLDVLNSLDSKLTRFRPRDFELFDSTIRVLHEGGIVSTSGGLDLLAGTWVRRLLRLGTVQDEGEPAVFWASEAIPKHRTIESYLPPVSLLNAFLNEQQLLPTPEKLTMRPSRHDLDWKLDPHHFILNAPSADELPASLKPQVRRLLVEIPRIVLRWIREQISSLTAESSSEERADFSNRARVALTDNRELAENLLDEGDLVRLFAVVADELARVSEATNRSETVNLSDVIEALDDIRTLTHSRRISDLGMGMDALELGAVIVRRYADKIAPSESQSEFNKNELLQKVRAYREVNHFVLTEEIGALRGASPAGYYLHNYAGYLSTHVDNEVDLRTALDLFKDRVIPSRRAYGAVGRMTELRRSLQISSRCSARLAELERAQSHEDSARELIAESLAFALEVLDMHDARSLMSYREPSQATFRLVEAVLPGLILAAELDLPETLTGARGDVHISQLLLLGEKWVDANPGREGGADSRFIREYRNRYRATRGGK